MAVQLDPPGQLQEFLGILKKRKWQIALPALFTLSLGIAFAVVVPKKYLVETQVELRALFLPDGGGAQSVKERTEGVAENAPQQIKSMRRITEVIEDLKWADYLTLDRKDQVEFRKRVRDNIAVTVPKKSSNVGSSFVTIEYLDVNKDRAQEFLKALRKAWIEQVVERDRTRIDVEFTNLLDRKGELEKEWYKEWQLLSQLRIDNEISPTQPTPGKNQQRIEDPAYARYNENTERLAQVELDLSADQALLALRRDQLSDVDPELPRTEVVGGVDLGKEIDALIERRGSLEEDLRGIKPLHHRYKSTQLELLKLDEQIAELEDQQTEAETTVEFDPNPRYQALRQEIVELEAKTASLEAERVALEELQALEREEMRKLAEAYREDSERSARIEILEATLAELELQLQSKRQLRDVIYGPSGNPFQILQEVETPSDPSEPDPALILAFSLVLGLALGLGSALYGEFSKSCFRNTADIARVMVVPVLGVISPIVTRVQRRRRAVRRVVVGSSSVVLIAAVLFVTWAWTFEPDLLGESMLDSIERFRELFL
ncbi:MAG: hypothetical protein H6828_13730 [Planctomycetes bacterium]|nr:hypothetical protein [Planctomycetota bacterium]